MELNAKAIVVIEDDEDDFIFTKIALQRAKLTNPIIHLNSAEVSIKFFEEYARGKSENNWKPGIVLLDINLPGMNGIEFLQWFKENESLSSLPVIMLSGSEEPTDVWTSYKSYANGYMQKPVHIEGFLEAVNALTDNSFELRFAR